MAPLNGFVTGAATLLLLLWLATTAITGALGFFASTMTNIAGAAAPVALEAVDQKAPSRRSGARPRSPGRREPQTAVPRQVRAGGAAGR